MRGVADMDLEDFRTSVCFRQWDVNTLLKSSAKPKNILKNAFVLSVHRRLDSSRAKPKTGLEK